VYKGVSPRIDWRKARIEEKFKQGVRDAHILRTFKYDLFTYHD